MRKRIALILTMIMLATSVYVPSEVYAKPQEDDSVIFDEDVVTTGEREIPKEYLTFEQGLTEADDNLETQQNAAEVVQESIPILGQITNDSEEEQSGMQEKQMGSMPVFLSVTDEENNDKIEADMAEEIAGSVSANDPSEGRTISENQIASGQMPEASADTNTVVYKFVPQISGTYFFRYKCTSSLGWTLFEQNQSEERVYLDCNTIYNTSDEDGKITSVMTVEMKAGSCYYVGFVGIYVTGEYEFQLQNVAAIEENQSVQVSGAASFTTFGDTLKLYSVQITGEMADQYMVLDGITGITGVGNGQYSFFARSARNIYILKKDMLESDDIETIEWSTTDVPRLDMGQDGKQVNVQLPVAGNIYDENMIEGYACFIPSESGYYAMAAHRRDTSGMNNYCSEEVYEVDTDNNWVQIDKSGNSYAPVCDLFYMESGKEYYIRSSVRNGEEPLANTYIDISFSKPYVVQAEIGKKAELSTADNAVLVCATIDNAGIYQISLSGGADACNIYYGYGNEMTLDKDQKRIIVLDKNNPFISVENVSEDSNELNGVQITLENADVKNIAINAQGVYQDNHKAARETSVWSFSPKETGQYIFMDAPDANGNIKLYHEKEMGQLSCIEYSRYLSLNKITYLTYELEKGEIYYFIYDNSTEDTNVTLEKLEGKTVTEQTATSQIQQVGYFIYNCEQAGFYEITVDGADQEYILCAGLDKYSINELNVTGKRTVYIETPGQYQILVIRNGVCSQKDEISLKVSAGANPSKLEENKETTIRLKDSGGEWVSFKPQKSGYYSLRMETKGNDNSLECIEMYEDPDSQEIISVGDMTCIEEKHEYDQKEKADIYTEVREGYFDAQNQYYLKPYVFYGNENCDVKLTLNMAETVEIEDAESFTIPSEPKFMLVKTDFVQNTMFHIKGMEDKYICMAQLSENASHVWRSINSAVTITAGEQECLVYNSTGRNVQLEQLTAEEIRENSSRQLELSDQETWIKYAPAKTGFYSISMPYDESVNLAAYSEEENMLWGMSVRCFAKASGCLYTMYLNAGTDYYFAFTADQPTEMNIRLYNVAKTDGLKEGENALKINQNLIGNNLFTESGVYYIKVTGAKKVYLRLLYGRKSYKLLTTREVTDEGSYININSEKMLSKKCPYVELITEPSSEEADISLDIKKVGYDAKQELALNKKYTEKPTGNIQQYSVVSDSDTWLRCTIQTKKPWDDNLNKISDEEWEKTQENGLYQYSCTRYYFKGNVSTFDIVQDQEYTICIEPFNKSLIFDYDRYTAFIASGGSIRVTDEYEDEDEMHGDYWKDPGHKYHFDASGFKNKNSVWLLSNNGTRVSWTNSWRDSYNDLLESEYKNGENVSAYISVINNGKHIYKITDIYTVSDTDLMSPKKKSASDTLSADDDIILVKSVPATVYVQKIKLNGKTTLTRGEKATVTATIDTLNKYQANDPNVSFTSSDSSVLKVSATGEIEAVSAGKADVICKSADGNATEKMNVTVTEPAKPAPSPTPVPVPTPSPTPAPEKKGTVVQPEKETGKYKVTNADKERPSVEYAGQTKAEKKKKTVTIPATVTSNGVKYEVTSVAPKSFKNNKKVTTVKMPATIEKIGSSAFEGCKKLKTVAIGKSTKSIGKNAFKNCKDLKTVTIKSTKVPKIDKSAFKGVNKKCVIKVPKKLVKKYKQLFKKKGIKLKVKAI